MDPPNNAINAPPSNDGNTNDNNDKQGLSDKDELGDGRHLLERRRQPLW
jgi:hypothetical protein